MTLPIAQYIDHTLLKQDATGSDIEKLCKEALEHRFVSVCVNPRYVAQCFELLDDKVAVCTVVGFPLGNNTTETKVFETTQAIKSGAREIDMVINVGDVKYGSMDLVKSDIQAVKDACGASAILKVIIESAILTNDEKRLLAELVVECGAEYVKTSTGMNKAGGATVEDVKLLAGIVHPKGVKVKAAGGIRDAQTTLKMIEAGADRIGTSSGLAIVAELT